MRIGLAAAAALLSVTFSVPMAEAQALGPLRWQLLPFCNVVTLTITPNGAHYGLQGTDDQCGGAASPAGVVGLAYPRPTGDIGMSLTTVLAPSATPVHVDVTISIATLSGSWRDSVGNSGTFAFTPGAAAPGAPRVVQTGGLPSGSVGTPQIAPAAVTTSRLATNVISTSALIAPGTIEMSDFNQQGVGSVGLFATLPAEGCRASESTGNSAIRAGDLLLPSIYSGTAGVFMLPTIASADGRMSYVLCNSSPVAVGAAMSFFVRRVPR